MGVGNVDINVGAIRRSAVAKLKVGAGGAGRRSGEKLLISIH